MKICIVLLSLFLVIFVTVLPVDAEEERKVRLAYLQNDLHHLACWVALEKGFFSQEGVCVEVEGVFKAGPEEMTAFAAGSLDVGYVGQAPATMAAANKTARIVALAQVNKEGSAVVVRRDSLITHVSDLKNKIAAVPGYSQVQDFLLRKALVAHQVDPQTVTIIVLKPPEMIAALRTSQIDAFIAWEPYPAKAVTMGVGKVLVQSQHIWKDHPCCVLVADTDFLRRRPDDAERIVRAHVQATAYIQAHQEEAVRVAVTFTGMDEETIRLALASIKYDCMPSLEGEAEYVTFLNDLRYLAVPDAITFSKSFFDTTILNSIIDP